MGIEFERIINTQVVDWNFMKCMICSLLMNNPSMCGICRTHFCYICLKNYRQQYQDKCPRHGEVIEREEIRKPAQEVVEQEARIIVRCQYCRQPFKLNELRRHERVCDYKDNPQANIIQSAPQLPQNQQFAPQQSQKNSAPQILQKQQFIQSQISLPEIKLPSQTASPLKLQSALPLINQHDIKIQNQLMQSEQRSQIQQPQQTSMMPNYQGQMPIFFKKINIQPKQQESYSPEKSQFQLQPPRKQSPKSRQRERPLLLPSFSNREPYQPAMNEIKKQFPSYQSSSPIPHQKELPVPADHLIQKIQDHTEKVRRKDRKPLFKQTEDFLNNNVIKPNPMKFEIPSLQILDVHKKLGDNQRKLDQFRYFQEPETVKVENPRSKIQEDFLKPRRFSYLESFERAQDELRENINLMQDTLQLNKHKIEKTFGQNDESNKTIGFKSPYLQEVKTRSFNQSSQSFDSQRSSKSQVQFGYRSILDKYQDGMMQNNIMSELQQTKLQLQQLQQQIQGTQQNNPQHQIQLNPYSNTYIQPLQSQKNQIPVAPSPVYNIHIQPNNQPMQPAVTVPFNGNPQLQMKADGSLDMQHVAFDQKLDFLFSKLQERHNIGESELQLPSQSIMMMQRDETQQQNMIYQQSFLM